MLEETRAFEPPNIDGTISGQEQYIPYLFTHNQELWEKVGQKKYYIPNTHKSGTNASYNYEHFRFEILSIVGRQNGSQKHCSIKLAYHYASSPDNTLDMTETCKLGLNDDGQYDKNLDLRSETIVETGASLPDNKCALADADACFGKAEIRNTTCLRE